MCPDTTNSPSDNHNDLQPHAVGKDPLPDDSAGVTVSNDLQPHGNSQAPTTQAQHRRNTRRTGRHVIVRGARHDPPDVHKIAQVVADLAASMAPHETDQHRQEGCQ